jgi:hypothetical protein
MEKIKQTIKNLIAKIKEFILSGYDKWK